MLASLPASRPAERETAKGTVISALLHVGIVAALVIGSTSPRTQPSVSQPTRVVPLTAPATPPMPSVPLRGEPTESQPTQPMTPRLPAIDVPDVRFSVIDVPTRLPPLPLRPLAPLGRGGLGSSPAPAPQVGGGGAAHSATAVDVPVSLLRTSALPRYPAALRQAGVEGAVWVRFVVDADGRVDLRTVTVLQTSHPAFTESVRGVLPRLRFSPARLNGARVPQLVEMPFRFELEETHRRPIFGAQGASPQAPLSGSIPPDS